MTKKIKIKKIREVKKKSIKKTPQKIFVPRESQTLYKIIEQHSDEISDALDLISMKFSEFEKDAIASPSHCLDKINSLFTREEAHRLSALNDLDTPTEDDRKKWREEHDGDEYPQDGSRLHLLCERVREAGGDTLPQTNDLLQYEQEWEHAKSQQIILLDIGNARPFLNAVVLTYFVKPMEEAIEENDRLKKEISNEKIELEEIKSEKERIYNEAKKESQKSREEQQEPTEKRSGVDSLDKHIEDSQAGNDIIPSGGNASKPTSKQNGAITGKIILEWVGQNKEKSFSRNDAKMYFHKDVYDQLELLVRKKSLRSKRDGNIIKYTYVQPKPAPPAAPRPKTDDTKGDAEEVTPKQQ